MSDETPEQGDDFDDVLAADEEFPEGEYRLSTGPGVVSEGP